MRKTVAIVVASAIFWCTGSVLADSVSLLSVQSGHSVLLNTDGLTRVAVGDGRIAGVVPVGTSQVVVNGKSPGHTTIFIWANGHRQTYELTVTEQQLDDLAQMLRTSITEPNVQVVSFDHSIVVRGTVRDGAHYQQLSDIVARFDPIAKQQKEALVNAVTISQALGDMQKAIASLPGASDIRVDPDGKGNVIVSGNATDAVTAQAILDRARGLAGPYLSSDGRLIDRLNSMTTSQVDIKVYVLEVDKTALSNLGLQLQSGITQPGGTILLAPPSFPSFEEIRGAGKAFTVGPFFRTVVLAPTINLLLTEGHARLLSSPDLVTTPGSPATFLVGGQIPVVTSTALGQVNVVYKDFGVQPNVTPTILGNGSIEAKVAPEVSELDFQNAVTISGFTIPALKTSRLATDVITKAGESIMLGGIVRRIQQREVSKIPLLGEIPILGKLFSSVQYQNQETDVVFVMTPEIITR
ncbi:MAG: type II and III secretion system protein family protein [Vulcanimicrobiaceae bacterium]